MLSWKLILIYSMEFPCLTGAVDGSRSRNIITAPAPQTLFLLSSLNWSREWFSWFQVEPP